MSPSGSVADHVAVTDANVVSERAGPLVMVNVGGRFLKLNACCAGLGSFSPSLSIARTWNTGREMPFGVNTLNSESLRVDRTHCVSDGASGFRNRSSKPTTVPSGSVPNQYRWTL